MSLFVQFNSALNTLYTLQPPLSGVIQRRGEGLHISLCYMYGVAFLPDHRAEKAVVEVSCLYRPMRISREMRRQGCSNGVACLKLVRNINVEQPMYVTFNVVRHLEAQYYWHCLNVCAASLHQIDVPNSTL